MERLLYISQAPHLENIRAACEAGCKWIQLRVKEIAGDAQHVKECADPGDAQRVKERADVQSADDAQHVKEHADVQSADGAQLMKESADVQSADTAQLMKEHDDVQSTDDALHVKEHADVQSADGAQLMKVRTDVQLTDDIAQLKNDDLHNTRLLLATAAKKICDEFGAKLSINDHPAIAAQVNAYGVHVGKLDVPVKEARMIAGDQSWLGGTANTIEDVLAHVNDGVDYVGVGPFRFTTTKEKLSPILGLEGYQQLMAQLGNKIPVLAIGGILLEDIPALKEAGVYGVAVSGLITHAIDKKEMVQKINAIWNH